MNQHNLIKYGFLSGMFEKTGLWEDIKDMWYGLSPRMQKGITYGAIGAPVGGTIGYFAQPENKLRNVLIGAGLGGAAGGLGGYYLPKLSPTEEYLQEEAKPEERRWWRRLPEEKQKLFTSAPGYMWLTPETKQKLITTEFPEITKPNIGPKESERLSYTREALTTHWPKGRRKYEVEEFFQYPKEQQKRIIEDLKAGRVAVLDLAGPLSKIRSSKLRSALYELPTDDLALSFIKKYTPKELDLMEDYSPKTIAEVTRLDIKIDPKKVQSHTVENVFSHVPTNTRKQIFANKVKLENLNDFDSKEITQLMEIPKTKLPEGSTWDNISATLQSGDDPRTGLVFKQVDPFDDRSFELYRKYKNTFRRMDTGNRFKLLQALKFNEDTVKGANAEDIYRFVRLPEQTRYYAAQFTGGIKKVLGDPQESLYKAQDLLTQKHGSVADFMRRMMIKVKQVQSLRQKGKK